MNSTRHDGTWPIVLVGGGRERDEDCACPDGALALSWDGSADSADTDCACPDGVATLSTDAASTARPISASANAPRFRQAPDSLVQSLAPGFRLAFSPYAPTGPAVLNEAAWQRWQSFATPQPMSQAIDSVLAAQRLILPATSMPRLATGQPETLTVWMHVTNACNLDCPYCYVRKSPAHMTEATGRQAIEQVAETAAARGFRRLKLKYAGGEATLRFDLIKRLHERAQTVTQANGLALREVLLSNGTRLREPDADWLAAQGMKLMLSVDGVGATHDALRSTRGGRGTFDRISTTVDKVLLPRGIRPDVTVTVSCHNASGAAAAVRWALERDLPVSLNFYRETSQSASRADLALEEESIIEGMLAAYAVFEEYLPTRPFFNGLLDRVQGEAHTHTCGVGLAYLVISHEGHLAQCQMHVNNVPVAPREGDLIELVTAGPIQNISVDQKAGCRECVYRYRCAGGCPLETFRATGRWDVQSPHCRIYKALMPEALRLEGLRLLKQYGHLDHSPSRLTSSVGN